MDVFGHGLDHGDKEDSRGSDDVQMTLEEAGEEAGAISGVVTALTLDADGQYQFSTDSGQVPMTYRVVQVTRGEDGQTQILSSLSPGESILQGLLGGCPSSPSDDSVPAGSRLAYLPTANGGGSESGLSGALENQAGGGSFYVMVAPRQEEGAAQSGQRQLVPRYSAALKPDRPLHISRDDRRRATHNEVERRRRDKINTWITQLGKLVPDCSAEQTRQGDSKGGILSKTCEFIVELQTANAQMAESLKEAEQHSADADLRRQLDELRRQNEQLRAELRRHGIEPMNLANSAH